MDRADTPDTASSPENRGRPTKRTKAVLIGGTLLVSMAVIVWLRPWEQQSEPLQPETPTAKELFALEETCTTVALSPDGRILAFDHNEADISEAEVRLYDIERRQVNNKFLGWMGRRGHQPRLAFSHDGSLLVTSGGTLVWDIKGKKELIKSADFQGSIFAVHPSKNILAVAGTMTGDDDYERLSLLDPATGERVIRLEWRDNPEFDLGRASCLAFSPDGPMLAAGYDKTILVWDSGSGKVVNELTYDSQVAHIGLCAIAFGPNGKTLAAAHAHAGPVLWDLDSGEHAWEVPVYPTGRREHTAVAFSPDGGVLAVITSGHYPAAGSSHGPALVHLWDVASQEFLGKVETQALGPSGKRAEIHAPVIFFPDGKRLLTLSGGRPTIWDISDLLPK